MSEKSLKVFPRDEVYGETLEYFSGDTLAAEVWINKYCLKDSDGNLYEKNPDQMHRRLAKEFARIENNYKNPLTEEVIYERLKKFNRIVPGGSSMNGIGNDFQVTSLSNCFVIGNEKDSDSYGGIMKLEQEMVQLQKRRGGVGLDLSFIRPAGTPVKNSAITSTGVVPFMERYSNSTKEVAQDGRRGALMESISILHPDAENFIDAKMEKGKVTGANISVKITDAFIKAVKNDEQFIQHYPVDWKDFYQDELTTGFISELEEGNLKEDKLYVLGKGFYAKFVNARRIWKKIIHNAWEKAEPGILFWDNIINESIPDCYSDLGYKTVSTNPCGEIPLCPNDSCRLLALNLYGYVENPFTPEAKFNFDLFKLDTIIAQRLMDDIVDLEIEKIGKIIEKIKNDPEDDFIKQYEINVWENILKKTAEGRRTGLGVTAEGDMLAALGYRYGTDDANKFSESVHETLKLSAYESSLIMAKERGAFPIYNAIRESNNPFIQRIKDKDSQLCADMITYGRRNLALLTIAPTGTVSLMTQTTSGVECVFLPVYKRSKKVNPSDKNIRVDRVDDEGIAWTEYSVFHKRFEDWLVIKGYDLDVIRSMKGDQIDEIIKQSPYYKATSQDVDWVKKVEMQGMVQKHIDHSISVTVNLPKEVSEDVVKAVYETGWDCGCKGITVYREGSREGVLASEKERERKNRLELYRDNHVPKRPKRLKGEIHRFQNNLEKWIAVVGINDDRPYEIFTGRLENGLSKLPNSVNECEIVKIVFNDKDGNRQKRYDLEYMDNDEKIILEGVSHTFNKTYWNYAKFISAVLRHGMPIIYTYELIETLDFDEDHINTWKNGVARVIKRYIKDGEKKKGTCQVCGGSDFEYKEGCLLCIGCGWSACS
jgi:ribonucleoside-diphosphate reductase alpha chain